MTVSKELHLWTHTSWGFWSSKVGPLINVSVRSLFDAHVGSGGGEKEGCGAAGQPGSWSRLSFPYCAEFSIDCQILGGFLGGGVGGRETDSSSACPLGELCCYYTFRIFKPYLPGTNGSVKVNMCACLTFIAVAPQLQYTCNILIIFFFNNTHVKYAWWLSRTNICQLV